MNKYRILGFSSSFLLLIVIITTTSGSVPDASGSIENSVDEILESVEDKIDQAKDEAEDISDEVRDNIDDAIKSREVFGESWTVVEVTDHGELDPYTFGRGHGFQTPDETSIFIIRTD